MCFLFTERLTINDGCNKYYRTIRRIRVRKKFFVTCSPGPVITLPIPGKQFGKRQICCLTFELPDKKLKH